MAKHKFISTVPNVNENKTPNGLIDSGGTHYLFYLKDSFLTYEMIEKEEVLFASGKSSVFDKGTIELPIGSGLFVDAYQTSAF